MLQLDNFSLSLHTKESDQLTQKEGILQASEQAAALSKHPQTCLSASCCSCRACWAATKLLISASRSCRLAIMFCSKQASVGEHQELKFAFNESLACSSLRSLSRCFATSASRASSSLTRPINVVCKCTCLVTVVLPMVAGL